MPPAAAPGAPGGDPGELIRYCDGHATSPLNHPRCRETSPHPQASPGETPRRLSRVQVIAAALAACSSMRRPNQTGPTGLRRPAPCILSKAEPVTVCVYLTLWAIVSDLFGTSAGRQTGPVGEPLPRGGPLFGRRIRLPRLPDPLGNRRKGAAGREFRKGHAESKVMHNMFSQNHLRHHHHSRCPQRDADAVHRGVQCPVAPGKNRRPGPEIAYRIPGLLHASGQRGEPQGDGTERPPYPWPLRCLRSFTYCLIASRSGSERSVIRT